MLTVRDSASSRVRFTEAAASAFAESTGPADGRSDLAAQLIMK